MEGSSQQSMWGVEVEVNSITSLVKWKRMRLTFLKRVVGVGESCQPPRPGHWRAMAALTLHFLFRKISAFDKKIPKVPPNTMTTALMPLILRKGR